MEVAIKPRLRWYGYFGKMRNVYNIIVRKHHGKRSLGRIKHTWENNTKMNLKETSCKNVDWIQMAQDQVT